MRVLLSAMSALARTSGPFARLKAISLECEKAGADIALCTAHDVNYSPIAGVREYPLDTPMPLGLSQIICPGNVFERRYNAKSVSQNGAAITVELSQFKPSELRRAADMATENSAYRIKAVELGRELAALGGTETVITHLKEL